MKYLCTLERIAACAVAACLALSCSDSDEGSKIAPDGAGGSSGSAATSGAGGFGNQPMGGGGMAGPFGGNDPFGGNNPSGGRSDIDFEYGEEDRNFSECLATFCTPSSQGAPCCLNARGPCGVDYGNGCVQRRRDDNGGGQGGVGGRPQGTGGRSGGSGGNGATDDDGGTAGGADSGLSAEGGPIEAGSTDAAAPLADGSSADSNL